MLPQQTTSVPLLPYEWIQTSTKFQVYFRLRVSRHALRKQFIKLTHAREDFPPFCHVQHRVECGQIAQSLQLLLYVQLFILSTQCIYVFLTLHHSTDSLQITNLMHNAVQYAG